jgi:hypothetical protein
VRATFDPPFVVRPKCLYARWNPARPSPAWRVDFLGRHGEPPPTISQIESHTEWLEVTQEPDTERAAHLRVQVVGAPPEPNEILTLTISATVNDDRVSIPVTLEAANE